MAIDIKTLNHNQLNDLIQRAKQRQTDLAGERLVKVRNKVHALLKAEGFTFDEVFGKSRKPRSKVKPKYRNPANKTETWTGRGKRPRWFSAALAAGKKEKDLLIG
ncbi:H-NS histone family protein [Dokdonella sp.]|uniref:H-NS histone family protein n=1 Tax=Dokdonella sp. TaxID=2291710 RepID=UPI0025BA0A08|nr:H-NS histone family protein [Dokdonella sp.]MBX3692220.1 H-NS histone family protein [Dokdonella sp.]MCW5568181.1 H-NS histone family protein [Dokdonella sp.]